MPQHAAASQNFHMVDFFFKTYQTCEPFVAQMLQHWMVAQWSMYQVPVWRDLDQVPVWRDLGSIPRKGQIFACQFFSIVAQILAFLVLF